jgi:hypothetical protein
VISVSIGLHAHTLADAWPMITAKPANIAGPARRDSIHLLAAAVGALTLARAVDDPRLSDKLLESVHDSLASL